MWRQPWPRPGRPIPTCLSSPWAPAWAGRRPPARRHLRRRGRSVRRERTRLPRHRHQGDRRIQRWVSGRTGRIVLARLLRTRVSREWDRVPDADEPSPPSPLPSPSWSMTRTTGTSPPTMPACCHEWAAHQALWWYPGVARHRPALRPHWPPGAGRGQRPLALVSRAVAGGTPLGGLVVRGVGAGHVATRSARHTRAARRDTAPAITPATSTPSAPMRAPTMMSTTPRAPAATETVRPGMATRSS